MKTKFSFFLILGLAYAYALSSLSLPFLVKNYLAIVPFQLSALVYFVYLRSSQPSNRSSL
jgi:hypothetical protein